VAIFVIFVVSLSENKYDDDDTRMHGRPGMSRLTWHVTLPIGLSYRQSVVYLSLKEYHRLRVSASPVLTATLHSYGSLA